jgi:hypothetical protein
MPINRAVEELARRLAKEGIQAWLDKWHPIPGNPWHPDIEKSLGESETCAVFVGPSVLAPWQNEEMRAAIDRRVRDKRPRAEVTPREHAGEYRVRESAQMDCAKSVGATNSVQHKFCEFDFTAGFISFFSVLVLLGKFPLSRRPCLSLGCPPPDQL